jgi:hypothetical protein
LKELETKVSHSAKEWKYNLRKMINKNGIKPCPGTDKSYLSIDSSEVCGK